MKTAIMGAGSLGTIIGAFLAKSGLDVLLIDINKENTDALNKNGARVIGHAELQAPVRACTPDQMEGEYDLVLLLTKQWNNPTALPPLNAHLKAESIVCTLQNGIPEESVGSFVGAERVVGGTVGFGAIWREPGVSELATTMDYVRRFAFDIGEISNKITPKLEKVAAVLNNVGHTEILENFTGARWSKLLMNATFSGMSAALGCSFGEVLHSPEAMPHLMRIADETVRAAHASGVTLINMQSFDFNQFALTGQDDADRLLPVYRRIWANHTATRASMLQDIEKGRPCEIDYINGHVCAKGRTWGVATPANDHVVKLVKQAEKVGKAPDFTTNLATFKEI